MGNTVISQPLASEVLLPLATLRRQQGMPVQRSKNTLQAWCVRGAKAGTGERIRLECVNIDGTLHSSVEAVRRLIAQLVPLTVKDGQVLTRPNRHSKKRFR